MLLLLNPLVLLSFWGAASYGQASWLGGCGDGCGRQGAIVSGEPEIVFNQLRPLLDLVDRLGRGLDWALTYTNARTAEESPAANNPLHKLELDNAITGLADYQRAKENK